MLLGPQGSYCEIRRCTVQVAVSAGRHLISHTGD
jgi:hypothetical protein